MSDGQSEANARLIAAAPELLATLQRVLALLPGPIWNEHGVLVWSGFDAEQVRHAIAHATGEAS